MALWVGFQCKDSVFSLAVNIPHCLLYSLLFYFLFLPMSREREEERERLM